jgi:cytochrome c peroxidase
MTRRNAEVLAGLAERSAGVLAGLLWLAASLSVACRSIAHDTDTAAVASLVALGRTVFFDPALSADGRVSCASCHQPDRAYSDGRPRAAGIAGRTGTRNAPGLLDVGRQHSLFWDGRRAHLEDQALDPLLNEVEHGLASEGQLLDRLRADARYPAAFAAAFASEPITARHVANALAAFERTLVSGPSPFDRFRAGDRDAMPPAARRGWVVFDQQAHCTHCHLATSDDGLPPLFTDHGFHSLAVGFHRIERTLPQLTVRLAALRRGGQPLGRDVLQSSALAELGRFAVTLDPRDLAAFKTPGLRNVARTAPYMHDGSVATLGEAVDLEVYSRGARDARPIILTPSERDDLITFLHALTCDDTSRHAAPPAP